MLDFSALNRLNDSQEGLSVQCSMNDQFSPAAAVVSLKGYLDHSNSIEFADAVLDFFSGDWENHPFILDLEGLQYISSSGIGTFTTIRVQAEHKNSPFYLLKMDNKVRSVFDQLGFTSFFNIIDSLESVLS
ncbi:MAG: STAS domain-containing protein [Spirochaetales bacterium]|nr:STAS domain-containing protein [Spirochaetales bacterium]